MSLSNTYCEQPSNVIDMQLCKWDRNKLFIHIDKPIFSDALVITWSSIFVFDSKFVLYYNSVVSDPYDVA